MSTILPNSPEIEKLLLGEIILEPKVFDEVNSLIGVETFYDSNNAKVYETIRDLANDGVGIDQMSIYERAKKSGINLDIKFLSGLTLGVTSSANAVTHSKILAEKWMLRKLMATKKIFEKINDKSDPFEVLSEFSEEIYQIENRIGVYQKDYNLKDHIGDLINKIEAKYNGTIESGLMSSTFPSLNRATGGIMPTDYVIVYGLDKSAKSTLGYRLLLDFAFQKKNIGIFSLEMDFEQVAYKQLSMITGIEYLKMRNPRGNNLQPHELQDFVSKVRKIENTNIYIDDKTFDFNRVVSKSRLWKRKYGIDIFFYDYMGLFDSSDKAESVKYLIKSYSRRLKQLAKELSTPIILVSQANEKDKTADAIDLLRDCDFALRICKPKEIGIESMTVGDKNHQFTKEEFLVTVERSRHGVNKQNFVCGFINENFVEINIGEQYQGGADEYII